MSETVCTADTGMPPVFVYLDHNVLDFLVKKRLSALPFVVENAQIIFVFSAETLREIRRSQGFEKEFLDVLQTLDARYINVDLHGTRVGTTGTIARCDHHALYKDFVPAPIGKGPTSESLIPLLQNLMGLNSERSIPALLETLFAEVRQSVTNIREELREKEANKLLSEGQYELLERQLSELEASSSSMPQIPDIKQPERSELDKIFNAGPIELNNIQDPDVVGQVWRRFPDEIRSAMSAGQFFGIERGPMRPAPPISRAEKVHSVFWMLNFVGYFRDNKLAKSSKMIASMSDMSHVGYASFCDVVLSRDQKFVMKARAAYEFVGCKTQVVFLSSM